MPTYNPAAPWAGPYPVAVIDEDTGIEWEAYGPRQLKRPTVTITQAEDCCLYTTTVTEALPAAGEPTAPAFLPPGKSAGDTFLVCHPNGLAMYECNGGPAWDLAWHKVFPDQQVLRICVGAETAPYGGEALLERSHIVQPYVSPLGGTYRGDATDCGVPINKCDATNKLRGAPEHDRICFIANSGVINGGDLQPIPVGNTPVAESALISVTNTTCRIYRGVRRVEGRVRVSTTLGNTQVIQNQQISINGGAYSSAENDMVSNLDGQNIQVALVADRLSCQTNVLPGATTSVQSRLNLNVIGPNGVEWSDSEASALIDVSTTRS